MTTILLMIASAIVGWVLRSMLPSWNLWDWWTKRRQSQRDADALEALRGELAANSGHLAVGKYMISDVAGIQLFDPPLNIDDVATHYRSTEYPLPEDLRELEFDYLTRKVEASRNSGKVMDFNDSFALRELRIERLDRGGVRSNRPVLTFEPSNYKYYLMCNDALDLPLLSQSTGRQETIRQRYLKEALPFDWANLRNVPFHMWFATVTGVVTADRQLVVSLRSDMQGILDSRTKGVWRGAMSVAEGMFRPADSRSPLPSQDPSPFKTAIRALHDELGLTVGQEFSELDVQLIGLGFDLKRYQPLAVFFVSLPRTTFRELREMWQLAKDRQENRDIVGVEATSEAMAELLVGKQRYQDRPIELFSNHQRLGVLVTSLHLFKTPAMSAALLRRAS